ncbi:hypothetical protein GYN07_28435 (plasmid) [Rhizobium leguminosarum bv. viciae 248]|uniref:hypothetical protein n=1 Tax=Rhizobium leguminosarum TaxID=384 RepID=UPI0003745B89|nr:hypothetical protein [Rhizobium leguminosarum]MBY5835435.1 hypothetical protein [Rhizobium leguminosarum]MCA2406371.1 hypothetical protein [Rhizobium leguminosarum]QHW27619.1 hypothetical protein GYN07_28435 [Rhizobium leguminosarum bv. viciae 248]QSZ11567.1 hypothetical protein J3P71_29275 [Rhizobium leguminosarum]
MSYAHSIGRDKSAFGFVLVIRPDRRSGRTEGMSIFEPDKGSDGLLVINGNNYLKDDGK